MSDLGLGIFQDGIARGEAKGKAKLASQIESVAHKIIAGASIDDALTSSDVAEEDYPIVRNIVSLLTGMRK